MNHGADILDLLFTQGTGRPSHPAVNGQQIVTYGAFCSQVRRLAAAIARKQEAPRVLIHLSQDADAYVAMFATLAAGGVYATTNLQAPVAKHRMVLQEFEPHLVVSTPELHSALVAEGPNTVLVEPRQEDGEELSSPHPQHRLGYVMFTSGSTGKPKGVMVSRSALQHYVDWMLNTFQVRPTDRLSQHPNIAFDISITDIYGALCAGATLIPVASPADRLMPAAAIRRHGITIWNSVPSVINLMTEARQLTRENLASLRLINFCGEPLLPEHLEAIFAARADLLVQNTYGPTETTISVTLLRVNAQNYREAALTTMALGDPIEDMDIVLDGGGDSGEIVITGAQLAEGYWRNPEGTARAFRTIMVDGKPRHGYFTGDLGVRVHGHLYFKTRLDNQTKIRGHRLELDEVNWALRKCGIGNGVSTIVANGHLHAFIESPSQTIDADAIRKKLADWLEPHAIPTEFHTISQLPRNQNDKINTRALIDLVQNMPKTEP